MSAFAIFNILVGSASILVGAAFGQRLKVFVLLPAMLVISCVAITFGLIARVDLWTMASSVIVSSIGLQFGYIGGATIRLVIAASCAERRSRRQSARFASNTSH